MEFPLGEYIGNKYEVLECLEAMKENSPYFSILDRIQFDETAVGNIKIEKL
jgi:thymidine phosphorylase